MIVWKISKEEEEEEHHTNNNDDDDDDGDRKIWKSKDESRPSKQQHCRD